MSDAPKCSEVKANGEPCRSYATKTGKCAGHSRLGIASDPLMGAERSAAVRQAKAEQRKKSYLDLVAEALERKADEIVAAYLKAGLGEGDWRALEALATRVHGRPTERVETTEVRDVDGLSPEEREQLRAKLLEQYPHLRAA